MVSKCISDELTGALVLIQTLASRTAYQASGAKDL